MDKYKKAARKPDKFKTTKQILDEIASSEESDDLMANQDKKDIFKSSIEIDLQENMPHALVNDNLIYFDSTAQCYMVKNLSSLSKTRIDLYQMYDY